jgi:hypothetical protein
MAARYLRLRQICLAVADLDPAMADLESIFGVALAYRDPLVEAYGVRNAVYPFGLSFVELVAPLADDDAAARFVRRGPARGAYMAIFNCDDPAPYRERARALGIRIVAEVAHPGFGSIQLHPRDARATMIEFDHTPGEDDLQGPYYPAGGRSWTAALRLDRVAAVPEVELCAPDPAGLASHWSRILARPVRDDGSAPAIDVQLCRMRFVRGEVEALTTLTVALADPAPVLARAAARGYAVEDDRIRALGGVDFRLRR